MGMSKEELIEAINGTLISNEEKAITADALRNLLTDIVENSGGGGQGGGITLQISFETNEDVPTVTPEQIANNKEQIDILKQLHDEGKPIPPIALETTATIEGMEVTEMLPLTHVSVLWNITGTEVPEDMPEGLILPVVIVTSYITNSAFQLNGDGTLIPLE